MQMSPVFNVGEWVIITDAVDDFYNKKMGKVVEIKFSNYMKEHVYVVQLTHGYAMDFTADELTAENDYA